MRKQMITILISLLAFSNLSAQTDEQIINEILFDLFGFQHDTIFIKNLKTKTYFKFDSASFENMTGLSIPSIIISEWNDNEEKEGFIEFWSELNLNKIDTLFFENDTIFSKKPVFKCLTKGEIDLLLAQTKKKQYIYSISKMLFDNSKENAIFHFVTIPHLGAFYSHSILVKKVFGRWKIIGSFDFTMS